MNLISQKMGISEWSYHNDYNPAARQKMSHVDLTQRFEQLNIEVELGFYRGADGARSAALPELRHSRPCSREKLCIECDACVDICPVQCLTITRDGEETDLRLRLSAPAVNLDQALYASAPLPQTGRAHGQGRRRLRPLRPVRRALSHGGVGHAKVRPSHCLRRQRDEESACEIA